MPTVPRYNQPTVNPQALPGVRVNTTAPLEAFGGGASVEKMFNAGERLGEVGQQIYLKEKEKADDLATIEANTAAKKLKQSMLYDPKNGAMNIKGKNAFGIFETKGQEFTKGLDDIEKNLKNEEQIALFKKIRASHEDDFNGSLQRHVNAETQRYQEETIKAGLITAQEDAVFNFLDPGKVQANLQEQKNLILKQAQDNGWDQEKTDAVILEAQSKTHAAIINRMVNNGMDLGAKSYLAANKKFMAGTDISGLEKNLREGTIRGESQRQADAIVEKKVSKLEALDLVSRIKDPEIRDETKKRVKEWYYDQKLAKSELRNDLYMQAANLMETQPGKDPRQVIAPQIWTQLLPQHRKALEARSRNPDNDSKAWLDFIEMKKGDLKQMSRADFETKYWSKFDKEHRTRAEKAWEEAREGTGGKVNYLTDAYPYKDRLKDSLIEAKIIPKDGKYDEDQINDYTRYERLAAQRLQEFELDNGRKARGEEQQKIINDLLTKKVYLERRWWSDKEVPIGSVHNDDKGRAYVPLKDIPPDQITKIKNSLRKRGQKDSMEKVQKIYAAYLLNDEALVQALLAE